MACRRRTYQRSRYDISGRNVDARGDRVWDNRWGVIMMQGESKKSFANHERVFLLSECEAVAPRARSVKGHLYDR
jgi:hypothetical protein